jgi:hypothetical protein
LSALEGSTDLWVCHSAKHFQVLLVSLDIWCLASQIISVTLQKSWLSQFHAPVLAINICSIRSILATTLVRHHDKIIIGIINDDVIWMNEWTTHDSGFYWL